MAKAQYHYIIVIAYAKWKGQIQPKNMKNKTQQTPIITSGITQTTPEMRNLKQLKPKLANMLQLQQISRQQVHIMRMNKS